MSKVGKLIIWDFDGVIIESNEIRTKAFKKSLSFLDQELIEKFILYHESNGGLSRYHKLDWLQQQIDFELNKSEILKSFSEECYSNIVMKKPIIEENLKIILKENTHKHYIASGSDQKELRRICKKLDIDRYFKNILGSPTTKIEIIRKILLNENNPRDAILVGDSINDLQAAMANQIYFVPYCLELTKHADYQKIQSRQWFLRNL